MPNWLQATSVWLQAHSGEVQAVSAGVISIATLAYVFVTWSLWRATKLSAEAARASSEGAKKSADILAALHRPYFGVPLFQRQNDYNSDSWAIQWGVKNFGTLPACEVALRVEFSRNGKAQGNAVSRGPCEMLPQAGMEGLAELSVDRETRDNLHTGNWSLAADAKISYVAPGGSRYSHAATFVYDRAIQNFRPERSETTSGNH